MSGLDERRAESAFALDTEDVTGAMWISTKTDFLTSRFYMRYRGNLGYPHERSRTESTVSEDDPFAPREYTAPLRREVFD